MMNSSQPSGRHVLTKRNLLVSCVLGLFFLAIGMNLRGESGSGHNQKMSKRDTTSTDDTDIWQPEAGVKWQIQLVDPIEDTTVDADIWDIDLFENTAETITTLKDNGHKVICYFSAGTYEDWRPDINKFDPEDFGSNLDEWPGERWLDITSDKVRAIMSLRLDIAKDKGCDGVDPDNIDAYGNENGLGLTEADSIDFLTFLAKESHSRGMAIGLKNGGDIIGSVIDIMQWSINEQCAEYNECEVYAAFTEVNKPVFHIEYSGESLATRDYDDTTGLTSEAPTGSGGTVADSTAPEGSDDATLNQAGPLEYIDPKDGATGATTEAPTGSSVDPKDGTTTGSGDVSPKEDTTGATTEAPTGNGVDPKDGTTTGSGDVSPKEDTTGATTEAPTGNGGTTGDSVAPEGSDNITGSGEADPKEGTTTSSSVDPKEGTTGATTEAPTGSSGTAGDSIAPEGSDDTTLNQAGPLEYVDPKEGTTGATTEAPTGSSGTAGDSIAPEGSDDTTLNQAGPLEYVDPKEGTTGTTSGSDNTSASLAAPIEYLDLKVSDDTSSPAIKTPIGSEATATETVPTASTDADTTNSSSVSCSTGTSTDTCADINADDTKEKHLCGHGCYKVRRTRGILSSKLKTSACNAANTNKFSTVIKNMNLDTWVEYC
ncbi:CAZyme family GH114 [Penicillium robsamsonii]|uniref:CAZyme family GH114 n=1 Tax=Penicillium robsamsonii TaxID=1792511 RepID=UPI0025483E07|nr:CAZyme family GH114 [Penicillium robsamsonii]KAJ5835879.1 CAZyme family GH114 [Penicillium robsamsonii]